MSRLSEHSKQELMNALNGKQSGVFVVNGKLISIEVEDNDLPSKNEQILEDLPQEIEEFPELKESLSKYLDNPGMKRYTGSELKARRYEKRQ